MKDKNVKRRLQNLLSAGLLLSAVTLSCTNQNLTVGTDYALADKVETIPMNNIMSDSLWNIWCGSMVEGYDGKYHLFYSRWPRSTSHESWISHSEVAYAVSDNPGGPFHFVNVPLPAYSDTAWDGAMSHNPYIITKDGKYYLYYIATQGKQLEVDEILSGYSEEWWKRRNTQRIGLAVSDNPAGPWKRMEQPVLSNSEDLNAFDAMCVTNPAVCVGRGGKMVMLYKAVCKNGTISGGNVRFSVAFADSPTGPFVKTNQLIFQPEDPTARMIAEDPYIWYDKKQDTYYAIVRDVVGIFTGKESGGLALMESKDAIDWKCVPQPKVLPATLHLEDGSIYNAGEYHIERPFLFRDKHDTPQLLFGAFGVEKNGVRREHSFNAAIPFKINRFLDIKITDEN
ncbi:MAG: glycoside hydrolase family protein [Phocaeicola sp.]